MFTKHGVMGFATRIFFEEKIYIAEKYLESTDLSESVIRNQLTVCKIHICQHG